MKRTALKRKSPTKRVVDKSRTKSKGYQIPPWFMAIKPGSHGNTPAQKRLWRVVSEKYRAADFTQYGHRCPCCGVHMESWRDAQLGHWLRYSLCNSWYKYERINLAAICAGCNMKDDAITLKRLGEELQRRHGFDALDVIEIENQLLSGGKMETWQIVDYAARLRPDLVA